MNNTVTQSLENLPDEILALPRFFPVKKDKVPKLKGWSKPENQKLFSEIEGLAGFDTAAHGKGAEYLLLDFDHVLNDNGEFINADAEQLFNRVHEKLKSYCERSISGHGSHIIAKPTAGKFKRIAAGAKNGIFYFDKENDIKLELFYGTAGRYCLVTGNMFHCDPKATVAHGEVVDKVFQEILDMITDQNKSNATEQSKNTESPIQQPPEGKIFSYHEDNPEYDSFRARLMIEKIPIADLSGTEWLACTSAIKTLGFTYHEFDAMNQGGKNYNEEENRKRWDSDLSPTFDIETLHGIAKRYGYSEADTTRQWYQIHPEKSTKQAASKNNDIFADIRRQCKWSHDKNGNPTKIKSDVFNYKLIFERDPNLHGLFGRDNFRQETVFLKRAQWHDKNLQLKDTWDDTDDAELRLYLAEHYAEMGTPQRTLDFVIRAARENSFHAIRNFFESLPKWDGEERAKKIFVKFLGADDTAYTYEITMHFLFGAIARALYPGCDFQSVVVLQGAQGIGKSRLLRMLGGKHGVNPKGDSWHIALRDQLDDSHAVDAMRKGWIVEIEEFAAASKADVNSMKGVLSADDVTRRFAYDRHAKTIKAHWVFAATCNDDAPLRDQTGNRRFLPIKCRNKESTIVDGMTPDYIRKVLAEAYQKFKALFPTVNSFDADKLRLSPEMQAQAAKFAEGITQDDGLATEIKGFLDRKIPPLIIWYLLSKEERRKFHVDGGNITIELADIEARFKNTTGKRSDELKPTFDTACEVKDGFVRQFTGKDDRWYIVFYGAERRQHICAAEIFNECFGQDNRKRMPRINETLAQLDGWHAGERFRNDPAYPDQKKPYYRD